MSANSAIFNPTESTSAATGDGFSVPRLTTTGRLAIVFGAGDKGMMVYDTTLNNLFIWNGSAWESVPASGDSTNTQVIFNDNGILAGDAGLTYDKATDALTISGDLTVRTNKLKVDASGVGIGTTATTTGGGICCIQHASNNGLVIDATAGNPTLYLRNIVDTTPAKIMFTDNTGLLIANISSTLVTFSSSGNVGVGRSPLYRLQASSGTKTTTASLATVAGITTTDADDFGIYFRLKTDATGANRYAAITSFDNGSGNGARDLVLQDLGGNVGIGVTPSAWNSAVPALQVKGVSGVYGAGSSEFGSVQNCFYNASAAWIYGTTAAAGRYAISSGTHQWFTAASGTAGTTITDFATAKMTLDASGNLLVGTTGLNGSWNTKLTLSNDSGTTKWAVGPYLGGVANFLISAGASAGVYLNGTAATSWTSASDERLKDIIEPISNAIAKVGSLRAVIGKFKFDENNTRKPFLIAQDIQAVLPEAVDASNPEKLGVAYTDVIPLLVAAIKELTAEVNALKNA